MSYQIEIIGKVEASDPNLPSTFFPGSGSDHGEFKVTAKIMPSENEVESYLQEEIPDFYLQKFDKETGLGSFVVVDGWAPDVGTLYIYDGA